MGKETLSGEGMVVEARAPSLMISYSFLFKANLHIVHASQKIGRAKIRQKYSKFRIYKGRGGNILYFGI
jgi:hypothetical protein